ncbi:MAG TPA: ATP-binding cassette domain-containing protein [Gemmatimonadales bacterium]|jgi:ABC-type polysaccharide/polyol phosphate transport system ATPase subunit
MDHAVVVEHVWREFPPAHRRITLFNLLSGRADPGGRATQRVLALQDLSLAVQRGEKIGVIGNNAAGKSTFLKLLAGLLRPTRGVVRVQGERVLVTALGTGMLDELSVEENVVLYGSFYGVDRTRMRGLLPEILAWAELLGSEGAELRTLSSGTRARLAFAVIRHIETEVFLLDEALSAGDVSFKAKCREFFDGPRNRERTFVVATHEMDFVRSFCSKALWLHRGQQLGFGPSDAVVAAYLAAQGGAAPPGSG